MLHHYQGLPCCLSCCAGRCPARPRTTRPGIIRRHVKSIGSRWRKLSPGSRPCSCLPTCAKARRSRSWQQVSGSEGHGLALRHRDRGLARGPAPKLRQAVRDAKKGGHAYVVLDGALIPVDWVAADRPFYSEKHKRHGMNLQVIANPGRDIVRVSGALPGSAHDMKAEWIWGVLVELKGRASSSWPIRAIRAPRARRFPTKGKNKPESQKQANHAHVRLRAAGERANTQLKTWRILRRLRCCPLRAGQLAEAIHTLQIHGA